MTDMDSEISKIWEEALQYAAPLPVPEYTSLQTASAFNKSSNSDEENNNFGEGANNDTYKQCFTLSPGCNSQIYKGVDNSISCNKMDETWKTENVAGNTSITTGIQESLIRLFTESNVNTETINAANDNLSMAEAQDVDLILIQRDIKEYQQRQETLDTLPKGSPESSKTPNSALRDSLQELTKLGLSIDSNQDISGALAAGLKMIETGNELIAMTLKLSNSGSNNVDNDGSDAAATGTAVLETLSAPSSVDSINVSSVSSSSGDSINISSVSTSSGDSVNISSVSASSVDSINIPSFSDVMEVETSYKQTDHTLGMVTDIFGSQSAAASPFSHTSENSLQESSSSSIEPKIKRRRKREKNLDPSPLSPILPPCRICDDKSSGFHYGANTCEACKGFFRRTLKKKVVTFKCKCNKSEMQAWQQGPYRNGCPACRYTRCLKVGMSKTGIKIGRYTLNRKTENILEVKSLKEMDLVIEKAILSAVNQNNSPNSLSLDSPTFSSEISSPEGVGVLESSPLVDFLSCSSAASSVCTQDPQLSLMEIESIVADLTEAHTSYMASEPSVSNRPKDEVDKRHRQYIEDYNLKKEIFGHMKPLSKEEYLQFYNATGIDVDGRKEAMLEAMPFWRKRIRRFVQFSKCIPGFKELSLKDQASLIKFSRPEHVIIASYKSILKSVNTELQVATTPWGKEVHIQDITRIFPIEVLKLRFKHCQRLQSLDLTIEEEAMVRAIVVTFSDRTDLEDPTAVQDIQYKMMKCLEHLFNTRSKQRRISIHKVTDILTRFREFSEMKYKATKELLFDWPILCTLVKDFSI